MSNTNSTYATKKIGLFDSGVGGLSILRILQNKTNSFKFNPYSFVYLADSSRCPYGNKSYAEITQYVEEIINWFNNYGVNQIVMACNTSAAVAGKKAKQISKVPVSDLILPSAKFAAQNFKRIVILATKATVDTKAFSQSIKNINSQAEVLEIACPDLVPLVEQGHLEGTQVEQITKKYSDSVLEFKAEAIILGCTHFPFLENVFAKQISRPIKFIDPAYYLSSELFRNDEKNELDQTFHQQNNSYAKSQFYTTGDLESFTRAAEICLSLDKHTLDRNTYKVSLNNLKQNITNSDQFIENKLSKSLQSNF